jgi:hypothetical protein
MPLYNNLTKAIRAVDDKHIIFYEVRWRNTTARFDPFLPRALRRVAVFGSPPRGRGARFFAVHPAFLEHVSHVLLCMCARVSSSP